MTSNLLDSKKFISLAKTSLVDMKINKATKAELISKFRISQGFRDLIPQYYLKWKEKENNTTHKELSEKIKAFYRKNLDCRSEKFLRIDEAFYKKQAKIRRRYQKLSNDHILQLKPSYRNILSTRRIQERLSTRVVS